MKKITKSISMFFMLFVGLCGYSQLPQEGFEDVGVFPPTGWAIYNNGIGPAATWIQSSGDQAIQPAYEGTYAAYLNKENVATGLAEDWLVTPQFNVPGNPELHFFSRLTINGDNGSIYRVLITSGDPADLSGYALVEEWTEFEINPVQADYLEKVVMLPTNLVGQNVHVAFVMANDNGDRWLIDNVSVTSTPEECIEPTDLLAENIGATSAHLTWDAGTVSQWEVEVVLESETPTGSGVIVSNIAEYDPSNLIANTDYKFYVRALCNSGADQTSWAGPYSFSTYLCEVSDQCEYTFILRGDFGVGWFDTTMNITQNGEVIQEIGPSFTFGYEMEINVVLCDNTPFEVVWDNAGILTEQVGLDIVNNYEQVVYSLPFDSSDLVGSTLYQETLDCGTPACLPPAGLDVANPTISTADVSWENVPGDYEYMYLPTGSTPPTDSDSGTVISANSVTVDNLDPSTSYDFYVRLVCSPTSSSEWSTIEFMTAVGNDECSDAIEAPVNSTAACDQYSEVLFLGATPSAEPVCEGVNGGDVWYEFTALNHTHLITLNDFSVGGSDAEPYVLSLYEDACGANLGTPLYCSISNAISAIGLTEGATYKIRISLNSNTATPPDNVCNLCITVPDVSQGDDQCLVTTINFDFEEPEIDLGGWGMFHQNAVPGWRTTASDGMIEYWSTGFNGVPSYSGNQFIELNANLVSGVYQDYVAPEGTVFNYGFAHRGRSGTDTCQLLAGPPGGPYAPVTSVSTGTSDWSYNTGTYTVPAGQSVTRFIFEAVSSAGGATVGNFLDAISFTATTGIVTPSPVAADCGNPEVEVEAIGVGTWVPYSTNPAVTTITDANSNITTISGFSTPGEYYYEWTTPFCNSTIVINYAGGDVPEPTVTDVNYCTGDLATALSADILADHTAVWYSNETGGTPLAEAPTPDTSVAGVTTYYVSQLSNSGCESPRAALTVTVTEMPVADVLPDVTECGSYTLPALSANNNYYTGSGATGDMLTAGNEITTDQTIYIYAEVAGTNCNNESSFSVTIINTPAPTVTDVTYCQGAVATVLTADVLANHTAIWYTEETGGTPLTGAPTPDTSVAGTTIYYVSQSETNGCESTRVPLTVTVIEMPQANVIDNQTACDSYILPALSANNNYYTGSGATGDILTAGTEITVNQTIYVYAQTPGSNCTDESSFDVAIIPTPVLGIVGGCVDAAYTLEVSLDENYTFEDVTIQWLDPSGTVVSTESTVQAEQEGDYTVIITPLAGNSCSVTLMQNVDSIACLIPRGISPNGDDMNDTFDLSGFNVTSISIFNRYGKEVFNYGTYSNQWHGQSNNGNELPTGTYFYSLQLNTGESKTGWVYLNRQQ